jgi:hypothetical protein
MSLKKFVAAACVSALAFFSAVAMAHHWPRN